MRSVISAIIGGSLRIKTDEEKKASCPLNYPYEDIVKALLVFERNKENQWIKSY